MTFQCIYSRWLRGHRLWMSIILTTVLLFTLFQEAHAQSCEPIFKPNFQRVFAMNGYVDLNGAKLTDLLAPKVEWVSDQNFVIKDSFIQWYRRTQGVDLNYRDLEDLDWDHDPFKLHFSNFLAEQQRTVDNAKEKLVKIYKDRVFKHVHSKELKTIQFKNQIFKNSILLGEGAEGDVYLVFDSSSVFVLKKFKKNNLEAFRVALEAYKALAESQINAVRLMDSSESEFTLKLTFAPGFVIGSKDFNFFKKNEKELSTVIEALKVLHAVFANSLIAVVGKDLIPISQTYRAFNPHLNNIVFNPEKNRWTLIDPY